MLEFLDEEPPDGETTLFAKIVGLHFGSMAEKLGSADLTKKVTAWIEEHARAKHRDEEGGSDAD